MGVAGFGKARQDHDPHGFGTRHQGPRHQGQQHQGQRHQGGRSLGPREASSQGVGAQGVGARDPGPWGWRRRALGAVILPLAAALLAVTGLPAGAQTNGAPAASPQAASGQTLDRVGRGEPFRIGYRHFAPPYSFAAANGQAAGYIVDLCREVAEGVKRALKLPKLPIEYIKVTAEDRFEAVRDGRIDVLCEPTSMTMSRRALVDFSLPTFIDGAGVVTRGTPVKGLEDLKGRKVGVLKGTTTEETLRSTLNQMRISADIVTVSDHPDGLRQLSEGKLDAYFGDRGILNYLISNSPVGRGLSLSDQYFTFETYALALPRGDQAFRLLVDSTLADLYRTERIREIYARSFGKFPPDQFLNALFVINGVPK